MSTNHEQANKVFVIAKGYERAASLMYQELTTLPRAKVSYLMPIVVNGAFCIELLFKCLLMLEDRSVLPRHPWSELFSNLSTASQTRVKDLYETSFQDPNYLRFKQYCEQNGVAELGKYIPLQTLLDTQGNSFVRWRYAYEESFEFENFSPHNIKAALKRRILEIKPDWN